MAVIYVFNNNTGQLERYNRNARDAMPYTTARTLTVREFMRNFDVGWTDLDTMQAWNNLRRFYGRPIHVASAFTTVADNGCLTNPQFYFGMAFELQPAGARFTQADLEQLYDAAVESGAFHFVTPMQLGAQSVTVDNRYMPSDYFITDGLPNLYRGRRCNQVMTVQSALNLYGYPLVLDGIFGQNTDNAVRRFQHKNYLTEDGIITNLEWTAIFDTGCLPV